MTLDLTLHRPDVSSAYPMLIWQKVAWAINDGRSGTHRILSESTTVITFYITCYFSANITLGCASFDFKFFRALWKPNLKSHLSAGWCLRLTPRPPRAECALTQSAQKNCALWVKAHSALCDLGQIMKIRSTDLSGEWCYGIYIRWMRRYYQTYGKEMVARQREGAIVRFGKEHFNERWLPGFRNLTERERYNIPKLGFLVVSLSETTSELLCHIRHMEGWQSSHPGKGIKSNC